MLDDDQLADILLDSDLIDRNELEQVLEQKSSETSLYRTLVHGDRVEEQPLVQLLSELLNVDYIDVSKLTPARDILELLPRDVALEHETLPLELERSEDNTTLVVAMSDPIDMMAMDDVASHTGIDIRPVLAGPKMLRSAIHRCYRDEASEPESPATDDPGQQNPGGIEDVDPTARRPAPPEHSDDVDASVPGRPVTDSGQSDEGAVELEAADEADTPDEADDDLPDERQPTRSELGRIAVERVAVSRDDLDEDGNVRPEALDEQRSDTGTDGESESLDDPERRERLENLVSQLDERSDTLLADEPEDTDSDADSNAPASDDAPEPPTASGEAADEQFGLLLAELAGGSASPEVRDAIASLDESELLKAAVAALVDNGQLALTDIAAHAPVDVSAVEDDSEPREGDRTDQSDDSGDGDSRGDTDQGTGPTFPSFDESESDEHGLGQVSSEVG